MNYDHLPPQHARGRNPDLEYTNLRMNLPVFTYQMLDSSVQIRMRAGEPRCSVNQVINEILDPWADLRWRQSDMDLRLTPENPFEIVSYRPRASQPEVELMEVRASVRKFTLDVIQAHIDVLYSGDSDASRGDVIRQILTSWALKRWHESSITIERVPVNPFAVASAPRGEEGGNV
ncbi:hypothetical protein DelCs14_2670 [Delftia sp. Cs1-4]|uniref:hypothetical protein n=1 Tax=Delftia sp. (strain Cs1-4) TaxID=742013 RepID=UPI00020E827C|nr:hypothetical protein [Delftia sp. Cs1-4]AEF89682.1 hypothetical protein DelCs14_2670 [Delftia sp. Cs1-4]